MERVVGIGGFFFRAEDPTSLGQWYLEHLGINMVPGIMRQSPSRKRQGRRLSRPSRRIRSISAVPIDNG